VELALALGYTIKKYNPRLADLSTELVLLVPIENDITPESLSKLEKVGWKLRTEDDVTVNGTENLYKGFVRNFIKFRVWSWTEYRKIVLLDADTMCMGDISLLLSDGFG
jgi:alpha-N-acetylglucosamine transferase